MSSDLQTRFVKAIRDSSPGIRSVYVNVRRARRFLRDSPRRAVLAALPPTPFRIPLDAGFLLLPPGAFEDTPAVVAEARGALAAYEAAPLSTKSRKKFLLNVIDQARLTLDSPTLRLALREDALATAARYLGVVPFLSNISVFYSGVAGQAPTSSQLFHLDGEDATQVKLWVYCTDVSQASGPLTVLDAAATREVQRRTKYQFGQRRTDEQVHAVVGASREQPIVGPVGTTAFVDTSRCFHFGSRVAADAPARLAVMIQYQTPYSFMLPDDAERVVPFRHLSHPGLTPLQQLVLGGSSRS
jgi:hypothetical protein